MARQLPRHAFIGISEKNIKIHLKSEFNIYLIISIPW